MNQSNQIRISILKYQETERITFMMSRDQFIETGDFGMKR